MWRIKGWNDTYENSRSREVQQCRFVCVPNKQDGDGYLTLLDHPKGPIQGATQYGAFVAIVLLASKCTPRGDLRQSNGVPHTAETIGRKVFLPASLIHETLSRCSDATIGWVEWVEDTQDATGLFEPAGVASGVSVGISVGVGARGDRVAREAGGGDLIGGASADGCRSDRQPPANASAMNGNGIGITSSSTSTTAAGEPPGLVLIGPGQERITVDAVHLAELEAAFGRTDVRACLADLAMRQAREPPLRRAEAEVPKLVRSWLKKEQNDIKQFPKDGGAARAARRSGPAIDRAAERTNKLAAAITAGSAA